MDNRLPPQEGEWIDRQRPIEFRFEGRTYGGYAGDVLSSAMWANDVRLLGRSFKYHRPRGVYSLAGHDCNVMVEDDTRTNLRGDLLPIETGLDVRAVNTMGDLERDWLNVTERFGRFLPVGFYYKAFHTPRSLFSLVERQMREVAGLGEIKRSARRHPSPKDYAFCDLLVVGAGPAGLSAASAAAEHGARVLVVDEQPRAGGSLCWQWGVDPAARETLAGLLANCENTDNIEMRLGTQAAGWYADHWVALLDRIRLTKLRAGATLVAAGGFEQPAVFGNNDLPGVMLGSAAQRLIRLYAVRPFHRGVILTANSDGYRVALDCLEAGVDVAAVVELRADVKQDDHEHARRVAAAKIPIHSGWAVVEALPTRDHRGVRGVTICPLNKQGEPDRGRVLSIDCDGLAMSVGWAPNVGLAHQAGARFRFDANAGQFTPAELPERLFIAGRANGIFDWRNQIADGRRAGFAAASVLGKFHGSIPEEIERQGPPPSHPYPILGDKRKKNFVDLDEDIHLADLTNAHQEGYDNVELLKRYSTFGMGPSQGKLSNVNSARILDRANGAALGSTGAPTSRPFHQPAPLGHLAGRGFHPIRRTPLHELLVGEGGQMVHAGAWLRPEYFAAADRSRDDCILDEARHVRRQVGLIDVSTLGKLHVAGPDAAEFLERIYTGRFAGQAVGRLRYGLACDETGVIIEDGVIARLADNHFYVTATSGGAGAFYRELQRWALLFDLDVTLINATGHLAAVNLAGPRSREILERLTDIDLSPRGFPYLAVRQAVVAGAKAVLMRVGFVGELGFEIHVPASAARTLHAALQDVGAARGLKSFGVEAQRLLRLEKGHLIVGQDTDALTNPLEADLRWALARRDKPFFVGGRALEIAQSKPIQRRLVGVLFPEHHVGPLPEECNLIIERGEIAGRITSIAKRSTLDRALALAFVRPDLAEIGTPVRVRLDNGRQVRAVVAQTPFYDPENRRQEVE